MDSPPRRLLVNHDDAEHGPKCQCIECQSLTDLENDWKYEHHKLYGPDGLMAEKE